MAFLSLFVPPYYTPSTKHLYDHLPAATNNQVQLALDDMRQDECSFSKDTRLPASSTPAPPQLTGENLLQLEQCSVELPDPLSPHTSPQESLASFTSETTSSDGTLQSDTSPPIQQPPESSLQPARPWYKFWNPQDKSQKRVVWKQWNKTPKEVKAQKCAQANQALKSDDLPFSSTDILIFNKDRKTWQSNIQGKFEFLENNHPQFTTAAFFSPMQVKFKLPLNRAKSQIFGEVIGAGTLLLAVWWTIPYFFDIEGAFTLTPIIISTVVIGLVCSLVFAFAYKEVKEKENFHKDSLFYQALCILKAAIHKADTALDKLAILVDQKSNSKGTNSFWQLWTWDRFLKALALLFGTALLVFTTVGALYGIPEIGLQNIIDGTGEATTIFISTGVISFLVGCFFVYEKVKSWSAHDERALRNRNTKWLEATLYRLPSKKEPPSENMTHLASQYEGDDSEDGEEPRGTAWERNTLEKTL